MKHTIILAASAALFAAVPAQAQPVAADLLPAYEVATIVTSMGMRPVGRPAWRQGRYIVAAIDRYGREVNVVLDAVDGQVLAVRPLDRNSFGAPPPPAYGARRAPYGPMDGTAPPPDAGPGAMPPLDQDDPEFFDNDRQQGSMPPPRLGARPAPVPRDPAATGSVTRTAPVVRGDPPQASPKASSPKDAAPMPRPRPALARANDPGSRTMPADKPAPAEKKVEDKKPEASRPDAKPAPNVQAEKPAAKVEASQPAAKPEKDVRVIDLSKPKTATKPEDKPGEAIRF